MSFKKYLEESKSQLLVVAETTRPTGTSEHEILGYPVLKAIAETGIVDIKLKPKQNILVKWSIDQELNIHPISISITNKLKEVVQHDVIPKWKEEKLLEWLLKNTSD